MEFGPFNSKLKDNYDIDINGIGSIDLEIKSEARDTKGLIDEYGADFTDLVGASRVSVVTPSRERSSYGAEIIIEWGLNVIPSKWGIHHMSIDVFTVAGTVLIEEFEDNEVDRDNMDTELVEYEVEFTTKEWEHKVELEKLDITDSLTPAKIDIDFEEKKCIIYFE